MPLQVTERRHIGAVGGTHPEFEGCCFLKNYCQVGVIMPPYVEASHDNHPPARCFAVLDQGFAKLRPHKAAVHVKASLLHVAGRCVVAHQTPFYIPFFFPPFILWYTAVARRCDPPNT